MTAFGETIMDQQPITAGTDGSSTAMLHYAQPAPRSRWMSVAEVVAVLAMAVCLAFAVATVTVRVPRIGPSRMGVVATPPLVVLTLSLLLLGVARSRRGYLGLGLGYVLFIGCYVGLLGYFDEGPANTPVRMLAIAGGLVMTIATLTVMRRARQHQSLVSTAL